MEVQFLAMFVLFLCALARPILSRPAAIHFNGTDNAVFLGVWMLLGSVLMLPFFGHLLVDAWPTIQAKPYIVLASMGKGFLLWLTIVLIQQVRRHSSSGAEMRGMMSLGVLAIFNFAQGEMLNYWQWLSVIATFSLGILFVARGHLCHAPKNIKWIFLAAVFVIPGVTDYVVIGNTNWFVQFVFSALGLVISSMVYKRGKFNWKVAFTNPTCAMAGASFIITEVIILMLIVTYVPVTMAVLVMRMSVPTTMIISSLRWNEGSWVKQALFGGAVYLAALPMLLF